MAFTKGAANFTNGSKVVTGVSLTSGQLAFFASGTAVFVQSEGQLIEATGLPKDGNGDVIPNQFLLRDNWAGSTGSYTFVAFDTIEGLRDAVQSARGFSEQLQAFVESAEVNPVANSFVKRTGDGRGKFAPAIENDEALVKSQAQSSTTDTTEGALLRFGAFGLGAPIGIDPSTDLNTLSTPGTYSSTGPVSSLNNWPFTNGSNGFFVIKIENSSLNLVLQTVKVCRPTGGQIVGTEYSRSLDAALNPLSTWVKKYHENNILGPVSASGGVPTGALMEHDSNSDGEYWKYADGKLICKQYTVGYAGNVSPGYIATRTWTFPTPFSGNAPAVTGSFGMTNNSLEAGYTYGSFMTGGPNGGGLRNTQIDLRGEAVDPYTSGSIQREIWTMLAVGSWQ